jgi:hypothetical protein
LCQSITVSIKLSTKRAGACIRAGAFVRLFVFYAGRAFNPGVGIDQDKLRDRGTAYVREKLQLRAEYQTLSRLPKTRQILFTVRTYVDPLVNLEQSPAAAQALGAVRLLTHNFISTVIEFQLPCLSDSMRFYSSRQTDRQTGRQADRQTGRQTGRQADRQAGRQADRLLSYPVFPEVEWLCFC